MSSTESSGSDDVDVMAGAGDRGDDVPVVAAGRGEGDERGRGSVPLGDAWRCTYCTW